MLKIYVVGDSVYNMFNCIISKTMDYVVICESFNNMREYIIKNDYHIINENNELLIIKAINTKNHKIIIFKFIETNIFNYLSTCVFTFNAIAIEEDGSIIDPYKGKTDLDTKVLRLIGNTKEVLIKYPIYILKTIEYCVLLDFTISKELNSLLNDSKIVDLLDNINISDKINVLEIMLNYNTVKTINILSKYDKISKNLFNNRLKLLPYYYLKNN